MQEGSRVDIKAIGPTQRLRLARIDLVSSWRDLIHEQHPEYRTWQVRRDLLAKIQRDLASRRIAQEYCDIVCPAATSREVPNGKLNPMGRPDYDTVWEGMYEKKPSA